ncbi:MAG: BMP family ABC transporter substrate-binding protein [Saccharofermentans sp.]|nr:BMP family ABC transporter substrate-binding protein [Saccharofermentans sp.]
MKKAVSLTIIASIMCLTGMTGCSGTDVTELDSNVKTGGPGTAIEVGAVYVGRRTDDEGYTFIHNRALTEAMEALEIPVDTNLITVDKVVDEEELLEAVDQLAESGCDIIFGISEEYDFPLATAADMYPDIMFCGCGGVLSNGINLINYSGRLYEAAYIAGICAGYDSLDSGNNDIGYVHSWGDEDTQNYCNVNAFALGARAANPDAVIHVDLVSEWEDTDEVNAATEYLMSSCECGQVVSSLQISTVINWEVFYEFALQTAMNEGSSLDFYSDIGGSYYGGTEDGFIDAAIITQDASEQAIKASDIVTDLIASGQWTIFSGIALEFTDTDGDVTVSQIPRDIEDNEGNVVVQSGDRGLNDAVIRCYMNYFIDGVIDES